ncbi:MAG: DHH family phosphoesterase, partial [Candidatus Nanohaloarchaeota archaeon]|nr:DHH family phosphoesterase [Candidatus Nanohaloarchaeota archaeon]
MDLVKEFQEKIKQVSTDSKIMIFHDIDADGISAAVLLSKYFLKRGVSQIDYWYLKDGRRRIDSDLIQKLNKEGYDYFFILDIAGDEFKEELKQISSFIFIVDHHLIVNELKDLSHVLLIKPQIVDNSRDPSTYPTGWFLYNLLKPLFH